MPIYNYICKECHEEISVFHVMKEKIHKFEKCSAEDSLERLPPQYVEKKVVEAQPGDITKRKIEELREELNLEKHHLKNKEFEK